MPFSETMLRHLNEVITNYFLKFYWHSNTTNISHRWSQLFTNLGFAIYQHLHYSALLVTNRWQCQSKILLFGSNPCREGIVLWSQQLVERYSRELHLLVGSARYLFNANTTTARVQPRQLTQICVAALQRESSCKETLHVPEDSWFREEKRLL